MTGGMAKYWIIPRVGDKELPRVGHQLASCSLLISDVLNYYMVNFMMIVLIILVSVSQIFDVFCMTT